MGNTLEDHIISRCEAVLQKNEDYLALEKKLADAHGKNDIDTYSELSYRMQTVVIKSCYKLALKDMFNITNE